LGPFDAWASVLPIAQFILKAGLRLVGIAGPPGSGKSTLAKAIVTVANAWGDKPSMISMSLDDFYLSKIDRVAKGLRYRAQPGSHDIGEAVSVLEAVLERREFLRVPHFDHARDERGAPSEYSGTVESLILDGWIVGMQEYGYGKITDLLDAVIFIDCPIHLARYRRSDRDYRIQTESGGLEGFSHREMDEFWSTVLQPGILNWVMPIRERADIVITLDGAGRIVEATKKNKIRGRF